MTPQEPEQQPVVLPPASLTILVQRARTGDQEARDEICRVMLPRVLGLARLRMRQPLPATNASDIVQNVFKSFCEGLDEGKIPDLANRESLWWWLARMTCNKVTDAYRRNCRTTGGEAAQALNDEAVLVEVLTKELDPASAVETEELFESLVAVLTERQRQILAKRVEGQTVRDIAGQLGCHLSTVEAETRAIRNKWRRFAESQGWDDL